jgi:hypothetical protein
VNSRVAACAAVPAPFLPPSAICEKSQRVTEEGISVVTYDQRAAVIDHRRSAISPTRDTQGAPPCASCHRRSCGGTAAAHQVGPPPCPRLAATALRNPKPTGTRRHQQRRGDTAATLCSSHLGARTLFLHVRVVVRWFKNLGVIFIM